MHEQIKLELTERSTRQHQRSREQYPGLLSRARGQGTFCAVDICDDPTRSKILLMARDKGVLLGGCGERSIRFRPALIFKEYHVALFLNIFNDVLAQLK
ncbi:hypothetical protein WMY93_033441 [Mugilogobius chulae]|uniref:4-aminobutyrate aminotransferase n=1 Tax=Mugilogobius chulae TaxID=88201 RepID=A0AAW0MTV7_9GOBI